MRSLSFLAVYNDNLIRYLQTDLKSFIASIQPAITAIQKMHGTWSAISGDLTSLQNMVHTDVSTAEAAIASFVDQKVVDKWNALADAG